MYLSKFTMTLPLLILVCSTAVSQPAPVTSYQLDVNLSATETVASAQGTLKITAWTPPKDGRRCLFLPLNDPQYKTDPARGLSPTVLRYGRNQRREGDIKIPADSKLLPQSSYLYEVRDFEPGMTIKFAAVLPRWEGESRKRWLFNDFYPIPLRECPPAEADTWNYQRDLNASITFRFATTSDHKVYHPGKPAAAGQAFTINAPKVTFYLAQETYERSIMVGPTRLTSVYYSAGFSNLLPHIRELLQEAQTLMGPLPGGQLLIIETEDLEKSLVPGIITINRERQKNINDRSTSALNWNIWQVANFLPMQWFGVYRFPRTMADFWLNKGFGDMVAYLLLRPRPNIANLFSAVHGESPLFEFDYRQAQDLVAAALTFFQPFNALTDKSGQNASSLPEQHAFGYIRHSLAMRYLYWYLGHDKFITLLRQYLDATSHQAITSTGFIAFLEQQQLATPQPLADIILQWWSQDTWPDYFLVDVNQESLPSGQWQGEVLLAQNQSYNLPISVVATDATGQTYSKRAYQVNDSLKASFITAAPIKTVDINPSREVYDANRFDNSNRGFDINIFPGDANSFADDAYTVLWLPLIAKLPGEAFSVLLATQMFRYVQSSYTSVLSLVPSEQRLGFQGYFLTDIPQFGLFTVMSLIQDFGSTYKGERIIDAGIYRAPFIFKEPNTEVGLRLRSRQTLGQPDSIHQTVALRLKVVPYNPSICHYEIKSDLESTPGETPGGFSYQRDFFQARTNCRLWNIDWGLRGFVGSLRSTGPLPGGIKFKAQNVDEARVRIDRPTIAASNKIHSYGLDILWAAKLPLPATMFFLPRESRFRLYFDTASTRDPQHEIRAGGGGLLIPIGGDAVGKNSISLFQLSLLGVVYRQVDSETDNSVGILFDFLGKL